MGIRRTTPKGNSEVGFLQPEPAFGKLWCCGSTEDPRCGGRGWSWRRRSCSPATNRCLVWRVPHGTKVVSSAKEETPSQAEGRGEIRVRLQLEQRKRDLALFNLAIDSKLRGCDLVRLRVNDVCVGGRVQDRATVIQQKTGRPVQFEITEQTRAAIRDWLADTGPASGRYLFPSRFHGQPHISTRQYARIVHRWVERAGLDSSAYGTHSMRRTKVAQIYKKTGNLRAVQLLSGTRSSKAPFVTSASRSTMRSASRSKSSLIQHKCGPVSGGAAITSFRRPSSARMKMGPDTPRADHRERSFSA